MTNHTEKYSELFDYLSADETPDRRTGLVVFGRKDLLVANKALDLLRTDRPYWAIITGGVGKDSGDLAEQGRTEADYLADHIESTAKSDVITLPTIFRERRATNGRRNVENSLYIMQTVGIPENADVTTVAHATSSRRLAKMFEKIAHEYTMPVNLYRVADDYPFNATNPADQKEARDEFNRLLKWPDLQPHDLPDNLIDFVTDVDKQ